MSLAIRRANISLISGASPAKRIASTAGPTIRRSGGAIFARGIACNFGLTSRTIHSAMRSQAHTTAPTALRSRRTIWTVLSPTSRPKGSTASPNWSAAGPNALSTTRPFERCRGVFRFFRILTGLVIDRVSSRYVYCSPSVLGKGLLSSTRPRISGSSHATAALRTSSMSVRYEIASARCTRETVAAPSRSASVRATRSTRV